MKVESNKTFEPISFTVTFETEEEARIFGKWTFYTDSLPTHAVLQEFISSPEKQVMEDQMTKLFHITQDLLE